MATAGNIDLLIDGVDESLSTKGARVTVSKSCICTRNFCRRRGGLAGLKLAGE